MKDKFVNRRSNRSTKIRFVVPRLLLFSFTALPLGCRLPQQQSRPTEAAQTLPAVDEIFKGVPLYYPTAGIVETLRDTVYDKKVFESYFPDDPAGTKLFQDLYGNLRRDPNSIQKVLRAARAGLRGAGSDGKYMLGVLANNFIWKGRPYDPNAVELVYYATFEEDFAEIAVYYGLSVIRPPKSPRILERCVDLCMIDQSTARILWGTRGRHSEMLPYVEPWLRHSDPKVRERAAVIKKTLEGKIDYEEFRSKQRLEYDTALYGDKMPLIRQVLAEGSSDRRHKMFDQIKRRRLSYLFDDSFRQPLLACLSDPKPQVRSYAIGFSGDLFCKRGEVKPEIIALMDKLSRDRDSKVRDEVAGFTSGKWINIEG